MIPTPDLSHLTQKDYEQVYEPAEDTFLLLDALEEDQEALRELRPQISLEIGSGSGCVTSFIAKILGSSVLYLCTDINIHANVCTLATGTKNGVHIDVITASLASPLQQRLKRSVDVILFNPPYVPTELNEMTNAQDQKGIDGAWAGGKYGMHVTDIFLDQVEGLLSPRGRFYLVALKQNNIPEIQERMMRKYNLQSQVVLSRRAGREHLFILRFTRSNP